MNKNSYQYTTDTQQFFCKYLKTIMSYSFGESVFRALQDSELQRQLWPILFYNMSYAIDIYLNVIALE